MAGLAVLAGLAQASAASYEISSFSDPSTPLVFTGATGWVVQDSLITSSPPTALNVGVATNPMGGNATATFGDGSVSVISPAGGRAYGEVGFYGYAGPPTFANVDTAPYNYYALTFSGATGELNIVAEMFSDFPTGPATYYIDSEVNVAPPASGPFTVYLPILTGPLAAGFNRADVNGFFFEIDVASDAVGPSWAVTNFALTSSAPEPSTWAMLALGFVGLACVRLRLSRRPAFPSA
jgi:hypothetical protein